MLLFKNTQLINYPLKFQIINTYIQENKKRIIIKIHFTLYIDEIKYSIFK